MDVLKPETLWFNTPDSNTLCRGGGNGPEHPSQLYAIKKYVKPYSWFLDYGCGSGTTYEAMAKEYGTDPFPFYYEGLDIIPKNVEWCKKTFPGVLFQVNNSINQINESSKTWDVVYSRHVVDHMKSFEEAMDEHCRVAKKLVIVVLWVPLYEGDEHIIKNIVDQGKTYENEYTNRYSRKKVMEYFKWKEIEEGWKLVELKEGIEKNEYSKSQGGSSAHDVIIVLQHE